MDISAESLGTLLAHINGGQAEQALPEVDELLTHEPSHPGLLTLRAEALRLVGRTDAALEAFKRAGESGAGPRNWLLAGILSTNERRIDEALDYLQRARAANPDDEEVLDALITTLFNSNRHGEGIEYARRQLLVSNNPNLMSRAALLLHSNDLYEEATAAFKRIIAIEPDAPALAGAALVPTRFTCDWDSIEELQRRINDCYARADFAAPQEYPLTNITWCTDEACNLGVTRAYVARMVPRAAAHVTHPSRATGQRIRIGYLSCDFRNHATMHLLAGLLEAHDRRRFEVFAYDYSNHDVSVYRTRFLNAIEHHVPIHSLTDQQAAERIANDQLDILLDLKLYTGGGRAGILAYRAAPIQAAYLGFPGSAASTDIDYIISDRFVTPDSSAPHYPEKFCRLPHSYQCNDRQRFVAREVATRRQYGLPEDKVVFGAFNQSYKIDRDSFSLWLRVLKEVPNSVLWLLGHSTAAITNLTRYAQREGVDPGRLLFAPFAQPEQHHSRLPLADAVLDALACNGHTTTSDALWAGVPVITARGRHFASRVSESLLNAMDLPELVGADPDAMVRIATRVGTDEDYRVALRARVAANRWTAPLFDTARHARNFETAIEMMVARNRRGLALDHIDVPDCGPLETAAPTAYQIVQVRPAGYIHAEAVTEIAECVHIGLRRLGLKSFYREAPDCPVRQIILGAHLLDAQAIDALPADAIIYNSEQIDDDSKWLTSHYVAALMKRSVWDYSAENVRRLMALGAQTIQFVPVGYVPEQHRIPTTNEDIDVLFYGSVNSRRQQIIDELKARGLNVVVLFGTYGEERDRAIARAKVVLIVHYYPAKIFEVVRAAYLLTNAKAVVAEGGPESFVEPELQDSMRGVPYEGLVDACVELVRDPAQRAALAEQGRRRFALRREEQILATALKLPFPATPLPNLPATLQLGSGKDFKADCLNIDINPAWGPDAVFDVSSPTLIGTTLQTQRFGAVTLAENSFDAAIATDVLEHIHDLTSAMSNLLRLLKPGGIFHILVPYDLSFGAWQDPTHVRAFNERSWLYYTDWHWYLGWTEARFDNIATEVVMSPLGVQMQNAGKSIEEILRTPRAVDSLQVRLRKRYLQESERQEARRRQPGPQALQ
jgi:predicted O-linked N-acetylglucosamine transferase (SPINDLY family)/SAM-dependent methyltransferase